MCLRKKVQIGWCLGVFFAFMQAYCTSAQSQENTLTLTKIFGRVEVQTIGEVKWQKARVGMKLNANQRIRTFEKARAIIDLGEDSTMVMGQDSIMDVLELTQKAWGQPGTASKTSKFKLWVGRIRTELKKINEDSSFEIVTPTGVAGVRGTRWSTFVDDDGACSVYVEEGKVWLENLMGTLKYLVLKKQIAKVNPAGEVEIPTNATPAQQDEYENQWQEDKGSAKPEAEKVKKEQEIASLAEIAPLAEIASPAEAAPLAETTSHPEPEKGKKCLNVGGMIGSRMINNSYYNELILQPEFSLGRFGIGLNILARWNDKGFREEDWDEVGNIVRYVRWAEKGAKPLYLRLGTMDRATLGNGFIVDLYSNRGTDTSKQALGSELDINLKNGGLETMVNDVTDPRLYGGRFYLRPLGGVPFLNKLTLGLTYVTDTEPPPGIKEDLTVYGADLNLPIIKKLLILYADVAKIKEHGQGMAYGLGGGLHVGMINFDLGYKLETRNLDSDFRPAIFNPIYEITRAGSLSLKAGEKAKGWYAETKMGLAKAVEVEFAMEEFEEHEPRVHGDLIIEEHFLHRLTGQNIGIAFSYDQEKEKDESLFDFAAKNSVTTQRITYGLSNKITLVYIHQWIIDRDGTKAKTSSLATRMSF